ncbi:helix-turn-helix domain-containing protein [Lactococcus garvieae]|uniref:helix-turn-helix domain-containing protein n=1 Tax=Lactococcus garvieae TaxID=1363 RepID=UPI003D78A91E
MSFYERLKSLAKENNKSFNQIEEDLGYGKNTLYNYKIQNPTQERLLELANYFNVSTDYLLGVNDRLTSSSPSIKNSKLEELITQIDHLDENVKEEIITKIRQLLEEETKDK